MGNDDENIYGKFKDSLDMYKSAYINYKTNPNSEKENHYFVSKHSLQNIYDKLIMTKNTIQDKVSDELSPSYNEKKKSLDELKSTLENIQNVEDSTELSSNRKSHFFYFLQREQVFLMILFILLFGFIIYSRYELKQSFEITRKYFKNKMSSVSTNVNVNVNRNTNVIE